LPEALRKQIKLNFKLNYF